MTSIRDGSAGRSVAQWVPSCSTTAVSSSARASWLESWRRKSSPRSAAAFSIVVRVSRGIERWIAHLLQVGVEVVPLIEAAGVDLTWYVGLDAEATRIGDALWNGEELDAAARERIVALYRLTLRNPEVALETARGAPIYLIMAMAPDRTLRMKPQNLVTGLPIDRVEVAS